MAYLTMTKRGSLIASSPSNSIATRTDMAGMAGSFVASPKGLAAKYYMFPYADTDRPPSRTSDNLTINLFGYKCYVDHSAPSGGNGLSWDTAFSNLNEALSSPYLYYTCVCQCQVVHMYVRGVVDYAVIPGNHDTSINVINYYNYLVIHDATFSYTTAISIAPSGMYVYVSGINFINCTFNLVQADGENGSGTLNDGTGNSGNTPDPIFLFAGNSYVFHSCTITLVQGKGGDGVNGITLPTDYSYTHGGNGGNGGNGGTIGLGTFSGSNNRTAVFYRCVFNITTKGGGKGGNGSDANFGGNGGDGGGEGTIVFVAHKMYDCHMVINLNPESAGGNGGSGAPYTEDGVSNPGLGGNGGIGKAYNSLDFDVKYVNKCSFKITLDASNVSGGDGGVHPDYTMYFYNDDDGSIGYTIKSKEYNGIPGDGYSNLWLDFGGWSVLKNSEVIVEISHHGGGSTVILGDISVKINDSYNTSIKIHDDCKFTPKVIKRKDTNCFNATLNHITLEVISCSNTTAEISLGTFSSLPDGEAVYKNSTEIYSHYSLGGCVSGDPYIYYAWLYVRSNRFPSDFIQKGDYGLNVTVHKPSTITQGFPYGGSIVGGIPTNGADGTPSIGSYSVDGGNATNAFTWHNWSAPAGTPGTGVHGVEGSSEGEDGILQGYTEYNSNVSEKDHVTISFI